MDQAKVDSFKKELDLMLKQYGLTMFAVIDFPIYKKLPAEVELAIAVLKRHGVEYKIAFQEAKDGNKS